MTLGRDETLRLLRASPVFASLAREDLEALSGRCAALEFARGEAVFGAEEWADRVWLVVSGLIRLQGRYNHDEPTLLDIMTPGALFGKLDGVPDDFYAVDAAALTEARLLSLSSVELSRRIARHPQVAAAILETLAARLQECGRLRALARCRAPARLGRTLQWLHAKVGDELPLTRQLLAEAAGVRRETAIRLLAPLERSGVIATRRGLIRVRHPRALSSLGQ